MSIQEWYESPTRDTQLGDTAESAMAGTMEAIAPRPKTDFQKWASGAQGDDRLKASMQQARKESPDLRAEVFQLQGKTGLPAELIQRNLDTVRDRVAAQDFDPKRFRQEFPKLAGAMEDPETAALAHDDLDSLQLLERTLSGLQGLDERELQWQVQSRTGRRPGDFGLDPRRLQDALNAEEIDLATFQEQFPRFATALTSGGESPESLARRDAAFDTLARTNDSQRFRDMGALEWFTEAPAAAFRQGRLAEKRNALAFEQMMAGGDPELEPRLTEMEGELGRDFGADGVMGGILTSAAEFLPMTLSSLQAGAETGAATAVGAGTAAAVLGQAGPQVATPEELFTVPGATAVGFAMGSRTGAAEYSFRQEAGAAYREYKAFRDEDGQPLDNATATVAASVAGGLSAGLELFGLETLVKSFPGGERVLGGVTRDSVKAALRNPTVRRAFADLGKRFAGVWSVETLTEVMQEGVVILGGEIAKGMDEGDFEGLTGEQLQARLTETLTQAAQGMVLLSAPGPVTNFAMDYGRARQARQTSEAMEALGEGARASKLRERLPSKYRDIVAKLREGGPIEAIQIPVERWNELFQSQMLDPAEIAHEVTGSYDGYAEAMATGGDVVIPVEAYAEKLAGGEFHDQLADNSRFRPGEMTPREAREWLDSAPEQVSRYLDESSSDDPSAAVYDDVYGQLLAAGRERSTADREARLTQAVFRSLGERTGRDPGELFRQYNVTVTRPLPEVLRQAGGNLDTDLDPLIDRLRAGDIPTQQDAFGQSLLDFLRERGIRDEGGELAARDVDAGRKAFQRAIARDDGMTLDDAAQAAAEAGYLEGRDRGTVTPDDLMAAIDRELRDEPVFSTQGGDTQVQQSREVLEQLGDYLLELGVDLDAMDNETVKRMLRGDEQPSPAEGEAATTLNQDGQPRLSAIHNISADGLAYADRMGGLAVPSIGVVTEEAGGVEGFGEITLIGRRDVADPSREAVFSSDAYTVRFPKPEHRGYSQADLKRLKGEIEPFVQRFEDTLFRHMLSEHGVDSPNASELVSRALRSPAVMGMYLESQGLGAEPVMKAGERGALAEVVDHPALAEWRDINAVGDAYVASFDGDPAPLQRFVEAFREAYIGTRLQQAKSDSQRPRIEALFERAYLDGSGNMRDGRITEVMREIESANREQAQEIDKVATQQALAEQIPDEAAFKQWVEETFVAPMGEPRIKVGRRKLPYTLDNIVDSMTRDRAIAGREETLTFGAGQVRAANAEQFQTLERMREAARDQIRDPAEYEQAKERSEALLDEYRNKVSAHTTIEDYRGRPDTWEGLDAAMRAVARYLGYKRRGRAAFERALKAEQFNVDGIKQGASSTEQVARWQQEIEDYLQFENRLLQRLEEIGPEHNAYQKVTDALEKTREQRREAEQALEGDSADVIAMGMQAAEALEQAPVPYFEAKPQRAVELGEFAGAVIPENASESVREILDRNGLPYREAPEGARAETVRAFRDELSQQGEEVLFQRRGNQPRGRISFPQSRRFFNIELLEGADLSTFLHESGHLYLEILRDLASRDDAPQQIRDDFQTILDWLGVADADAIGTEQHEQWARGFEAYLREGRAPSAELRDVFARFKAWLVAIYRTVRQLDVELTDEVRGVMDRLVATDEEIGSARDEAGFRPLFNDAAAAGMTAEEYEAYRSAAEQARHDAEDALTRRVMREYQRETKVWWKEAKAQVREEVAGEVNQRPEYVAMAVLGRGKLPDGSPLPEGMEPFKLNKAALKERYGQAFLKRLPRPYVYSREGGVHPDVAAEMFGYRSGDEMVQALVNARPRRELIEGEVTARMNERFGDMLNDGSMAEAALEVVHNDGRAEVMQRELRALASRSRRPASPMSAIKAAAQRIVAEKRVRDLRPDRYLRAEQKASREAFDAVAAGDFAAATEAKQKQLLNHELYREARDARAEVEKMVDLAARFNRRATRERIAKAGADYLAQIDALLTRYEFRRGTSLRRIDRRQSLDAWIAEQNEAGFTVDVPAAVADDARVVSYKSVTVEELRGLRDAVRQIEHLVRTKNRLLAERDRRDFEATVDSVVAAIDAHHQRVDRPVPLHESLKDKVASWASQAHAWHTKPEFLFRWLDGDREGGPVWRALFKPLADAEAREQDMQAETTRRLAEIMSVYTRKERAGWYGEARFIPAVGRSIDKARMLSIALNWGNQYNREVLMEGHGWSDAQVQAILSHLDARDWQVVQEIWDLVDSFWPETQRLEEELNGIAPEKVAPTPVETPAGTLRGGYYPIKYDTRVSYRAFQREEKAGQSLFENSFTRPATRKGHTKERQGSGGQQLRLDLDVLSEHIGQVIHDLSHRRAIIDVNRLAQNDQIRAAIEQTAGREMYKQIRPWLQSIANEVLQPESYWEKLIGQARVGATVVNMGLKVTTAVVQPLGYLNSVDMLGERYAWKGLTDFLGSRGGSVSPWTNMKRGTAFAQERSTLMRERQKTFDRDVRDSLQRLTKESRLQEWQRSFFYFTGLMDMAVSVPTWLGAYRKAMEGEVAEIELGDEPAAIDYADSIVRQTQSSGGVKDLAQIQRGGQVRRSFVMFYSYFSALYNQFSRQISRVKQGDISLPRLAASAMYLWFAPAILGELIAARGPDDDEEWASWAATQGILYPLGAVVGLRDVGNAVLTPFGYDASPAFDAFSMTARTAKIPLKALDEDQEVGRSDVKAAVLTAGYWGKLPARQAWITGEYLYDLATGEDTPESPQEFVRDLFFSRPADER